MATSPAKRRLARILRQLEIPDCGCPLEKLDCGCKAKADEAEVLLKQLRADHLQAMVMDDFEEVEAIGTEVALAVAALKYYRDCECPVAYKWPPCEHILARDKELGLQALAQHTANWQQWLSGLNPSVYEDPPAPPSSIQVLGKTERVEILCGRQRAGRHIWHPEDVSRTGLKVGHGVKNGRNGRPLQQDLKIQVQREQE